MTVLLHSAGVTFCSVQPHRVRAAEISEPRGIAHCSNIFSIPQPLVLRGRDLTVTSTTRNLCHTLLLSQGGRRRNDLLGVLQGLANASVKSLLIDGDSDRQIGYSHPHRFEYREIRIGWALPARGDHC